MKKLLILTTVCLLAISVFGQAKKPTIMVVPSDAWCKLNGFMMTFDNQGTVEKVPDYKEALQTSTDLLLVVSTINNMMADRGFPLKDLEKSMKSIQSNTAQNNMTTSKSGASLAESPLDKLKKTAKSDIIIQLTWTVNSTGPKKSITFNLQGFDAYTDKQVAGATGTGAPSFSAEIPVLLEEAVLGHIDNFAARLQTHFDDLFKNGREVSVDVMVWDDAGYDLETEFGGTELMEIIDGWMAANTVSGRYSKSDGSENFINFEQVRIPLYRQNGSAMDTETFVKDLGKFLKANHSLETKVMTKGLGKAVLVFGGK